MEQEMEYGIRYGKLPLGEKEYILYPVDIVQGYCVNDDFCSDTIYHKPSFENALEEENYLVDTIFSLSHLQLENEKVQLSLFEDEIHLQKQYQLVYFLVIYLFFLDNFHQ